ncbi:putative adhesin [Algoriphagus boseongensis]|uniref:Putative adhesin n=1 Tax=Algoriphagus boseongensis TaxID=1442587 RepID=A0A4R6T8N5_9BACT|nr:DUF4097 family beta strand repeat-containing protein [Algoriphagus boseongensis]TDQ18589.1 putative adhesin [Algoriphagus boseongensis]
MKKKNLNRFFGLAAMLLGSMLFLTSCYEELEVVQTVNDEFSGVTKIEVESGFLEVNYQGNSNQTFLSLDGLLESSRSGNYRIEYEVIGNTLHVQLKQKGAFGGGRNRGYLNLNGPEDMEVTIESGSGMTRVSTVNSEILKVFAGSGSIELNEVNSYKIHVEVGSGVIKGYDLNGNVIAKAGSGSMDFNRVIGDLEVFASSGNVEVSNLQGQLNSEMSSGRLQLENIDEVQNLRISSGNITGNRIGLGPKTLLSSSSGRIVLRTFSNLNDFNYDLQAGSGRVSVGENSSSGSLKINNGSTYTIHGSVSSGMIEINN